MVAEGADLLDVGGESTRPGHAPVDASRGASPGSCRSSRPSAPPCPAMPISIDTTKPSVAAAALDAGADLLNDVWGVGEDDALVRLAAAARRPDRPDAQPRRARYADVVAEVVADLRAPLDRALAARRRRGRDLIVDPGFGFGKTADHNLALLATSARCASLGRPSCSGRRASRPSGKVLDLPADQRLEATLATTALGIAAGRRHRPGPRRRGERPRRADERRDRPRHWHAGGRGAR